MLPGFLKVFAVEFEQLVHGGLLVHCEQGSEQCRAKICRRLGPHNAFTQEIIEAIAGQFATHETEAEPDAVQREDGSWLLSRWKPADDMAELLKLALPARRDYHTVAGFALARLGRFPRLGDRFEFGSWRFEVIDIDRRRIDKVLAQPLRKPVIAP